MENDHKKKGTEKNECRVKFQGDWFSISKFTDKHPGGIDVLQKVSGVDIEQFLSGESAVDGVKHKHSQNGYRILKKYAENQNVSKAEIGLVDLDKPVMSQIGRLGGKYWDWIHSPVDKDLRMFESDWLEFLTRNQWYIIPTLWMPLVLALSWIAFRLFTREENGNCFSALVIVALYFAFGIFVWSMMEYLLHRFAFHWKPPADSPSLIIFHFILHGLHHKTPMDGGRLVFPPPMAACMILLFFIVYQYLLRWPVCLAIGSGNLFGYICYDLTHYYLHHGLPSLGSYMHGLKGYHHAHHFKNPDLGRLFTIGMYLRYYLDEDGNRIYTLKKISPSGKPTSSAHPAWNLFGGGIIYAVLYRKDKETGKGEWVSLKTASEEIYGPPEFISVKKEDGSYEQQENPAFSQWLADKDRELDRKRQELFKDKKS